MEDYYTRDIKSGAGKLAYRFSTEFSGIRFLQSSSDLIFIRPNISERCMISTLYIPTPFLASALGIAVSYQAVLQQHSFFRVLSDHPTLCSTARWLFKSYAHVYFSTPNRSLLDGYLPRERDPHRIPAPCRMIIGSSALKDIQLPSNFYWRPEGPEESDFSGVDALICSGDVVWAVQFTTTSSCRSRTATEGLDKVFKIMKNKGVVTWHLVIMAVERRLAEACRDCQKLTGRWKGMRIYACELPLRIFFIDDQQRLQDTFDEVIRDIAGSCIHYSDLGLGQRDVPNGSKGRFRRADGRISSASLWWSSNKQSYPVRSHL